MSTPGWNRAPRGPKPSPGGRARGHATESGERGNGFRSAANVCLPATPSAPSPAQLWKPRREASVRAPKRPSMAPPGKPCHPSRNCREATSQPTLPNVMSRVPSRGRPRRPSAARVRGPTTPSAARPARRWNAATAAFVPGPRTPSIVPRYVPLARKATWSAATLGFPMPKAAEVVSSAVSSARTVTRSVI